TPADAGAGDGDERISRFNDAGVRDVLDTNVAGAKHDSCTHDDLLRFTTGSVEPMMTSFRSMLLFTDYLRRDFIQATQCIQRPGVSHPWQQLRDDIKQHVSAVPHIQIASHVPLICDSTPPRAIRIESVMSSLTLISSLVRV